MIVRLYAADHALGELFVYISSSLFSLVSLDFPAKWQWRLWEGHKKIANCQKGCDMAALWVGRAVVLS